jgi:hypothetical protein
VKPAKKLRRKTETKVLECATNNLLAALKKDMLAKEGRVDYDKLRKEGYSERLLARLEAA